ncbi:hypothetical protein GGH94_004369 [Coemansia aciculifera]|uniref:Coiled-coil domain-containing protein 16 n=1 Tax=Coemansia aciculifera TaxID=417176 RepID=A0A9W8M458_9FUNG|nr:hypothetical protein GGH94_004369 [Coemansia aciculifera]KAJ2873215.1 hypothetical protein GGH93_003402 [Coemansia aciculifera]
MSNASARDLLRRAREQKKQQKVQSNADNNINRLAAISNDSNARVDNKGNLFCRVCNVQVKPADTGSWKIHVASRRHQQQSKPTKRPHESDGISDISKLSIETGETTKRQKVDDGAQETTMLVGYGSDSEESEKFEEDIAESKVDGEETSELPAGFFDDGIKPDTRHDDEDEDDGVQAALPSGFFDNPDEQKAAETGAPLAPVVAVEQDTMLNERLIEFESDIADLTESTAALPDEEDVAELDQSEETELEHQSEMWRQRTDKLLHLRSIIKEGIRDMGLSEKDPLKADDVIMEEDNDTSEGSDSEYAELMNWRSGKIQ